MPSNSSSPTQPTPTLDNDYSYPEAEENIDEVLAPPPVFDSSKGPVQQHDYLESSTSNQSPPTTNDNIPENNDQVRTESAEKRRGRKTKRSSFYTTTLAKIITYTYLIFFAIFGTLVRLVIETLTFYSGAPATTPVLWANVGGSFVMGFLSEDQALFRINISAEQEQQQQQQQQQQHEEDREEEDKPTRQARHIAHKKGIPLYIGLTTGFCGCLTSFSTFERDIFLAMTNNLAVPLGPYSELSLLSQTGGTGGQQVPNAGFSFMAILAVMIMEVGLSLVSLKAGAHFAIFCSGWLPRIPHPVHLRRLIDPVVAFLALALWITVICIVILLPRSGNQQQFQLWDSAIWRGPNLFSLAFAPIGCLIRFYLSLRLNRYITGFPLGTFTANLGGTMILGIAFSLQHARLGSTSSGAGGGHSLVACQVLQGIMDGFCGCMTTVSTFVLELSDSRRRRHAYIYGCISLLVPMAMLVIEVGSLLWTKGFAVPVC